MRPDQRQRLDLGAVQRQRPRRVLKQNLALQCAGKRQRARGRRVDVLGAESRVRVRVDESRRLHGLVEDAQLESFGVDALQRIC